MCICGVGCVFGWVGNMVDGHLMRPKEDANAWLHVAAQGSVQRQQRERGVHVQGVHVDACEKRERKGAVIDYATSLVLHYSPFAQ